jgi:hypothetical protein
MIGKPGISFAGRPGLLGAITLVSTLVPFACMTAKEPAPSAAPLTPSPRTESSAAPQDLNALQQELDRSERDLLAQLSERKAQGEPALNTQAEPKKRKAEAKSAAEQPAQTSATPTERREEKKRAESRPAEEPQAEQTKQGSPCDLACRALQSMRRAANGICTITGPTDARCENARRRISDAAAEIERAGCVCAAE